MPYISIESGKLTAEQKKQFKNIINVTRQIGACGSTGENG